ncbi:phosphatase PAP2 family protein [Mycoplana sp. MJR14]|uniref:phosphatase PAP2 family protein n=1 Tax=Mycoplana sp. MJR14 TaxID=3032583 RepID=UPI0011D0E682|nr:phosphatase PAP2 family protein [Mycoplana sp. MJR14]MDF1632513.1 phosphatase PAP2 family protein [Mycoplana sp. MJR14]
MSSSKKVHGFINLSEPEASRGRGADALERHLSTVLLLLVAASAVFAVFPQLDLEFSRLFFDGERFPLADNALLEAFRTVPVGVGGFIVIVALLSLISRRFRARLGIRARDALVPIATYGLGVGLVVNEILKETIGRARPRDVWEFGGDSGFTSAWVMSDACQTNCSFTSGEAAGAIAMYSMLALFSPASSFLRRAAGGVICMTAAALGLNRIAVGAHFLSDVVLSVLITLAIMLAARAALQGPIGSFVDRRA